MSIILALETATAACSAALWLNGNIELQFEIAPQRHSDIILGMIDALLNKTQIELNHVDAIAFGSGPGSFMGVRIAAGVAQGLAFGIDRPVIPVSTLQVLAQAAYQKKKNEYILAGWDARMNSIYWGGYQVGSHGIMEPIILDQVSNPTDINWPDKDWLAAGNAWSIYQSFLKKSAPKMDADIYPDAASLALIANQKYLKGEVVPPEKSEPTYIRDQVTQAPFTNKN
ncbi:tRNA (adenosine(37)-N6)-threonylcarbamoyltransferase complex dimerization subunit type 1 TsaB [Coxiella burnetii]|uniref:tRNA threonylcarbamoyladenosine biosynthesis protein TsaB n=2 Tax=Coxiella burnetii TaxID=777 RepID=Q83BW6_COXBU|nr:tRNA (adenosine(37)-N6)-threonylcarbamoyltransferase complex dimerization subunit type 1 TsaB [Coxiella burnetii]NP_820360.1 peptidase M22 family non-proteolytic protein [Coxiella burnetii RSA 493]AAO90874.1 non-proteolytic protein, peptidase family M22 [Coxiella burnetii RSA 493]ARI66154.1 tRNA (adenosine(37)-N6)-threonylcarbamoyltransferase complex dimerization subunit type 1 TsaB [Coxiella burnetii]ARK27614.1 tRNA (adenosine(37)-N6)-threonylcarbamoyltransferase complex dimerization subuni